ncbi:hypothetical protein BLNAU_19356 [Blattamonas nauphoetae]|uniref:HAT C-terminal dimerisation domain-containing protein n=1 Tax=Blattamonas nauphoetae TaxID=2049346 RepID=A0ABQ9X1U3_9EUKA|nr:hypothetical protein BLNAU_19356 [Blattamonas nauphoetae]
MIRFLKQRQFQTLHIGLSELCGDGTGLGQYTALRTILDDFGLSLDQLNPLVELLRLFAILSTQLQFQKSTLFKSKKFFCGLPEEEAANLRTECNIFRSMLRNEENIQSFGKEASEWNLLKTILLSPRIQSASFHSVLDILISSTYDCFPLIQTLASIGKTIAVTTVPVEAGFRVIRWMKDLPRNRLSTKHLAQQLRLKLNTGHSHTAASFFDLAQQWLKSHYVIETKNIMLQDEV